jgi:hypothetical protein
MSPDHPVRLSMMVVKLASEACESCCRRPVDYLIYDMFVCSSCAEVAA